MISDLYTVCMKNQIETNQKEMTITDVGNLVLGLIVQVDNLDKKIENEIASLAAITAKGFVDVHNRIDVLEHRFDLLENKFGVLESNTNVGFQRVRQDIKDLDKKYATKEEVGRLALRRI